VSTYPLSLVAHSWLRWAVLLALVAVVARAWAGWRAGRAWTPLDERLHGALVGLADLQFLIGLWLFLAASPFARAFLEDVGTNVHVRMLRFFGLEHPTMMILAVTLLHVGRATSRKVADGRLRHKKVFLWSLFALICILGSIPWPGFPTERPLFRFYL
jgi:hypothetical protein